MNCSDQLLTFEMTSQCLDGENTNGLECYDSGESSDKFVEESVFEERKDKEYSYYDKQILKLHARKQKKCVICYNENAKIECSLCKFPLWCETCFSDLIKMMTDENYERDEGDDLFCDGCKSDNKVLLSTNMKPDPSCVVM